MDTEIFGFFTGIPADKHVWQAVFAYSLVISMKGAPQITAEAAECSLRQWVEHHRLPMVNKIFGSFAQLFTDTLNRPTDRKECARTICSAVGDYLHQEFHIALVFGAMWNVRRHYSRLDKK